MRLGLYQLQHATRIPSSAVVNDAVEIVKRGPTRSASGMVNAVLRRVVREGFPLLPEAPRAPIEDPRWRGQALAYLAVTHSHPAWLVERWLDRFGYDATEAWVRYDNTPADVTIWPLPALGSGPSAFDIPAVGIAALPAGDAAAPDAGVAGTPTRYVPGGIVLASGRDALPLIKDGVAYAQDEASAAVGVVAGTVGAWAGPRRLCVPGRQEPRDATRSCLRAPDSSPMTCGHVAWPCSRPRWHACLARRCPSCEVTAATCRFRAPSTRCSSMRPVPDSARCAATPTSAGAAPRPTCPAWSLEQRALIDEGLRALAPGGRLIYATCSSEPEENEALVADLLLARPDLRRVDLRQVGLPDSMTPLLAADGTLRTWPHVHGLDAFYAAVLEMRS